MKNSLFRKYLVLGIIILFVGTNAVSNITGNASTSSNVENVETNMGSVESEVILNRNIIYVDDDYNESTPGWGVTHFDKIQDAINWTMHDNSSDIVYMVCVYNGTYTENLKIYKSIDLVGENRETTIIDGDFNGIVVGLYLPKSVNISGFTIKNSGFGDDSGIGKYSSINNPIENLFITDNIIFDNANGISIFYHPDVDSLLNVTISNNIIRDNDVNGIELSNMQNVTVSNNIVRDNTDFGISLSDAQNVIISNNIIRDNGWTGIHFEPTLFDIITIDNNTINGSSEGIKVQAFYTNKTTIFNNNIFNIGLYGINYGYADSSAVCNIFWNNVSNCGDSGILLWSTTGADISNNSISNCGDGVHIYHSDNCTVSFNNISEINHNSIELWSSCRNIDILYNSLNDYYAMIMLYDVAGKGASEITIVGHTISYLRAEYSNKLTISNNNINQLNLVGAVNESIISNNVFYSQGSFAIDFQDGSLSHYNVVYNNTILAGYCTFYGNNHTISYNTFDKGGKGINISGNGNKFFCNTVSNASGTGVYIQDGYHENLIYHNNLINNTQNAFDDGTNTWDNGYPFGGNYWSDYNGTDANGDGIGDTPYDIPGGSNQDLYPLMYPWYPTHPDTVYVDDDYDNSTPGWGYDHFDNIQDGVDAVEENGTVYVFDGTYYENINVGKTVNLIGGDRNTTIIDGRNGTGIEVEAIDTIIRNVSVMNCSTGISINHDSSTIQNNKIFSNEYGILSGNNNKIVSNDIYSNLVGIALPHGSTNNIISNKVYDNLYGIFLFVSESNNITLNHVYNNTVQGIWLQHSTNNYITANTVYNNTNGIKLTIECTNTFLYHNNIINNTNNAYDDWINTWDNGYPSGGNYFSDYTGMDNNGDGIGDIPYDIEGGSNQDLYPLMHPWGEMPPVANFSYEINDLRVTFNPMSSFDRDGEIDYVIWDFGEPPQMQGPLGLVNHTYSSYGDYDVTLTVVDNNGYEGNITQVVSVDDLIPPEIIDNTPSTGYTGDLFTFNATITDAGGIDSAWVTWWYDSTAVSVELDYIGDDYYEKTITIQDTLDTMHYFIKVNDTSNNSQSTGTKNVTIYDNDNPEINDIYADPEIQIVGRYVNISAEVIDNIEVQSVYVHLRYPDAFEEDINITENKIGNTYFLNQTYNQDGEHRYHLQATDTSGNIVISSTYMFNMRDNEPPYAPLISGPSSGQAGEEYTYSFSTSDPDGDDVYYYIDWGDNTNSGWFGPYSSGEIIELSHTWEEQDTYTISARAKDSWGAIGEWGTLEVEMPVNQQVINPLLQMILERFPNAFLILRHLMGL